MKRKKILEKLKEIKQQASKYADSHYTVPYEELDTGYQKEHVGLVMGWEDAIQKVIETFHKESDYKWKRYRFYTKSVDDYRPLIFNPKYPWWCTGEAGDCSFATIVAYLPVKEDLKKYWDDAFDVEFTLRNEITFTSRFPKPEYYKE